MHWTREGRAISRDVCLPLVSALPPHGSWIGQLWVGQGAFLRVVTDVLPAAHMALWNHCWLLCSGSKVDATCPLPKGTNREQTQSRLSSESSVVSYRELSGFISKLICRSWRGLKVWNGYIGSICREANLAINTASSGLIVIKVLLTL